MKKIGLILLVLAFLLNCASSGQSPVSSPKVGDLAPDFSIVDVSGNEVKLSYFKGEKSVILVFYANNSWHACREQLGELQEKILEIKILDGEIMAFATLGNQYDVKSTKSEKRITYTLVPTPNSRSVTDAFGVKKGRKGLIIIDKKGRIRYKNFSIDYPSYSIVIRELGGV